MKGNFIYLDSHATTPADPAVIDVMNDCYQNNFGNPASNDHPFGWNAQKAVEKARKQTASLIGADESEIVFTSGATESNNTAIKGCAEILPKDRKHVIVSEVEHKCILEAAKYLQKLGIEVTFLPVTNEGVVDLEELKKVIRPDTGLVSIMYANNEVGGINPIAEIGKICHEKGIIFHVDGAQAIGHIEIDVKSDQIDLLSCSAHKFHGPKGIGFLYVNKDLPYKLPPLLSGGGQEHGFRSGTLNVPGIVGLGMAADIARRDFEQNWRYLHALRGTLFKQIVNALSDIHLNGPAFGEIPQGSRDLRRLPHNLNISPGGNLKAPDIIKLMRNVAVSSGSACTSATAEPSHVLTAMQIPPSLRDSAIRFGVGRMNTEDEVISAAAKFAQAVERLRN